MPTPEEIEAAAKAAAAANANAGGNGGNDDAAKQALLDKQFAERAERAAKAERQKFLDALGLKDEAEFEAYTKAKKEADDKNKSELEKAAEEAARAKAKADKLEAESKIALEMAQKRIMDGEIKLLASQPATDKEGKIIRPAFRADAFDIVADLLHKNYGKDIKDEDGAISGIEEALKNLAKDKPFLLAGEQKPSERTKGSPPPPSNNGGKPTPPATNEVVVGRTL